MGGIPRAQRSVGPWSFLLSAAAVLIAAAFLVVEDADASHLRGGTVAWSNEGPTQFDTSGTPTEYMINLTGQIFWKQNYQATSTTPSYVVGESYYCGSAGKGPGATQESWNMGFAGSENYCMTVIFSSGTTTSDWVIFEITRPDGSGIPGILHEYPAGGTFLAFDSWSCRLGSGDGHVNNACGSKIQRLETSITTPTAGAAPNDSPRVFIPPIFDCGPATVCHVPIVAWDPNGDPLSFRWSTAAEAEGSAFDQPGPCAAGCGSPAPATIIGSIPEVEWDTTGANDLGLPCGALYSAQLMVEDGKTKAPMDWFIRICPQNPPFWDYPLSPCKHLGAAVLVWDVGAAESFTVQARHNDSTKQVNLFRNPTPPLEPWMSWAPPAGPGNPISGTLSGTPPPAAQGKVFTQTFYAYQGGSYAAPCTVVIRVAGPPTADFVCMYPTLPYLRVDFLDASTDIDGDAIVDRQWDLGNGDSVSGAKGFSHMYGDGGTYMVTLTVTDARGMTDSVTKPCIAIPNPPPVIDPIPIQVVYEGEPVYFVVSGSDPDGYPVWFSWDRGPLMSSADFDLGTLEFFWQTQKGHAGEYLGVTFTVHDDEFAVSTTTGVIVLRVPEEPAPGQSDADDDGVPDGQDNCPYVSNPSQADSNGNAVGDACEGMTFEFNSERSEGKKDQIPGPEDASTIGEAPDTDRDGVPDGQDNCPSVPNAAQADRDRDGLGDFCDPDLDGDGVPQLDGYGRLLDNCPFKANADQADLDGDGFGDACEGDRDSDGVADEEDNCLWLPNTLQEDGDGDGVGDACQALPGAVGLFLPVLGTEPRAPVAGDAGSGVTADGLAEGLPAWSLMAGAGVLVALLAVVLVVGLRRRSA